MRLGRLVAAAVLGTCLAACSSSGGGSGGSSGGGATPTAGATTTPVAVPTVTVTVTVTVPASPGGPAGCLSSGLRASLTGLDHSAGHAHYLVVLTNTGSRPCVIGGYPGVSNVDAAGKQLGAPADRTGPAGRGITLAPGGHASAALTVTSPGIQTECTDASSIKPAAGLRIYPPANKGALFVAYPAGTTVCADPSVHEMQVATLIS